MWSCRAVETSTRRTLPPRIFVKLLVNLCFSSSSASSSGEVAVWMSEDTRLRPAMHGHRHCGEPVAVHTQVGAPGGAELEATR